MADEPVAAHREGIWERLNRWSRTHRTLVRAAAASLVVALIAAALIAIQQARAADRERKIADRETQARKAEQTARVAEQKALATANARLKQLGRANDLLAAIFTDLNPQAAEKEGKSLGYVLGVRLAKAAARLDGETVGDPLIVARLRDSLGMSLRNLG